MEMSEKASNIRIPHHHRNINFKKTKQIAQLLPANENILGTPN